MKKKISFLLLSLTAVSISFSTSASAKQQTPFCTWAGAEHDRWNDMANRGGGVSDGYFWSAGDCREFATGLAQDLVEQGCMM